MRLDWGTIIGLALTAMGLTFLVVLVAVATR